MTRWLVLASVLVCAPLTGVVAQNRREGGLSVVRFLPANCLSLIPARNESGLHDWRDLVRVEHCDRIKRLLRISAHLPEGERPIFYDGSILADMLPSDIGVSIPVLRVVFPERVFFDTDSAVLKPAAIEIVAIVAESLHYEPPDVVMFVAGHADARAERAYNADLSVARANALAEAVLQRDVNVASVWRVGFGEDLPLVAGDGEYAWGQNRRIEFLFAARPEALARWLVDQQVDQLCQGRTRRETEDCRRGLNFRPRYVIQQVTPVRRTPIRPLRSPPVPTRLAPVRRSEVTPAPGPHSRVDPAPAGRIASAPRGTTRTELNLTRARRIDLDLTRRTSGPIYQSDSQSQE